jgi:hypothetical protein
MVKSIVLTDSPYARQWVAYQTAETISIPVRKRAPMAQPQLSPLSRPVRRIFQAPLRLDRPSHGSAALFTRCDQCVIEHSISCANEEKRFRN